MNPEITTKANRGNDVTRANLWRTWVEVTFRPGPFFSRPPEKRSTSSPLLFSVLVNSCAAVFSVVFGFVFGNPSDDAVGLAMGQLVPTIVRTAVTLYISAGLLHLLLKLIGTGRRNEATPIGKKNEPLGQSDAPPAEIVAPFQPPTTLAGGAATKLGPFRETLQCVGYAAAPALFGMFGTLGAAIGSIWSIVIVSIAVSRVHGTTIVRAALATVGLFSAPIVIALGLRAGVVEAFKIPSAAMAPTLVPGDHLFVSKLTYGPMIPGIEKRLWTNLPPRRGDVIVFKFPEKEKTDFIKRTIALPGDTLEAIDGRPVINGWLAPHCYVGSLKAHSGESSLYLEYMEDRSYFTVFDNKPDDRACTTVEDCHAGQVCKAGVCGTTLEGPFHVHDGEVWVMGDNRNNSHDSRSWRGGLGAGVPFENIKGRAMFIWMSFASGGGVAQDRIFLDVMGRPQLPPASEPSLKSKLEECLRTRPSPADATPPKAQSGLVSPASDQ